MEDQISNLIKNTKNNNFIFTKTKDDPTKHLNERTKSVPNVAGLYLVFCRENLCSNDKHLIYNIEEIKHTLLYFGKAGGKTKSGKIINQGLNGRINNVVSDSSRKLKDIRRADYWNIFITENNIDNLYVFYFCHDEPAKIEDIIYNYLDDNSLMYPLMNKKRGRK